MRPLPASSPRVAPARADRPRPSVRPATARHPLRSKAAPPNATQDAPLVTFVVPCYRLAHYLPECVASIVAQDHPAIEILILDDASPDDTADASVALIAAHPGHRIRYVRNETNLGNIRTYNRGIGLAAGDYVWILSPDDRLRSPRVVGEYVRLMESRPSVAYAFCPGHLILDDADQGLYLASVVRPHDQVLDGTEFVKELVDGRFDMLAPSVLMRKWCYDTIALYPEDLPHRGDTFVWALAALGREVGYFAEPMVDYRVHAESMMSTLARENPARMVEDDLAVLWRILAAVSARRVRSVARRCENAIVQRYARSLMGIPVRGETLALPVSGLDDSLERFVCDARVRAAMRARVLGAYGDRLYWSGRAPEAVVAYRDAARASRGALTWNRLRVLAKLRLARGGQLASAARRGLGLARRIAGVRRRA
jgi:glycosyltransferase involved in cell wall biosynthesis